MEWRRPGASTVALFRSPVYTLGCVVATTSWGFHVGALALAPISLVQSVIAGGLVLVTVVADRVFGQTVTRREWIGVGADRGGARVPGRHARRHRRRRARRLRRSDAARLVGLAHGRRRSRWSRGRGAGGPVLAVSAGLLWAGSDITIKALSGKTATSGSAWCVHPFAFVILVLSLVGLLVSARSLQLGPVVPVIALTSATANAITIAAGPVVFGEPLPDGALALPCGARRSRW